MTLGQRGEDHKIYSCYNNRTTIIILNRAAMILARSESILGSEVLYGVALRETSRKVSYSRNS